MKMFSGAQSTPSRDMFELRLASQEDSCSLHDFFTKNLTSQEPLIAANGPHVVPEWKDSISSAVTQQGLSVVAIDSATGELIGAALNDEPPQNFPYIYTHDDSDVKFQKMFDYLERTSEVVKVAPQAVEIRLLAVDEKWRGRGVAQAIIQRSNEIFRQAGYKWSKMYCTSHFSNRLLSKLKWKKLYTLSYEDYVSEFGADIKVPDEPHTQCNLYICDLTKA